MSFRGMGDSIASSIWKQLDKFGNEVQLYPILSNELHTYWLGWIYNTSSLNACI